MTWILDVGLYGYDIWLGEVLLSFILSYKNCMTDED